MATLHRPFLVTPFLTTLSLILFIISTTTASPVSPVSSVSLTQLADVGPPMCVDGSSMIGKQYTKPRPADCTTLAGQLRYDPAASQKQYHNMQEHFLRGSSTCQVFIWTSPAGPDGDEASLMELANGIDNVVKSCLDSPDFKGGHFRAGDGKALYVWVTGIWNPWPYGDHQGLLDGGAANSTAANSTAANSTAVSRNIPRCEDGSSVISKLYAKPKAADCTALAHILRTSPTASQEQLITRQEHFLRKSGTCQLYITTHPAIRPSQDYASFDELADGIDSVVKTCIDNSDHPSYKGGNILAGTAKLLALGVTGIWEPFGSSAGQPVLLDGVMGANSFGGSVESVDVT